MTGAPLVTQASTVMCGHAGKATHTPSQIRVRASGAPAAVAADLFPVAGCALTGGPNPFCAVLTFTRPALRVRAGGRPVLTAASLPMGVGPGLPPTGQIRVRAQ